MTPIQDLQSRIAGLKARIRFLEEGLRYADHGAWGQDRERIRQAKAEVQSLEMQLRLGETTAEFDSWGPSA